MSKQRTDFKTNLPVIKELKALTERTKEQEEELQKLLLFLFDSIKQYGFFLLNSFLSSGKNAYSKKDLEDFEHDLMVCFLTYIDKYDADISCPTTYFKGPFIETIRNHCHYVFGITPYYFSLYKDIIKQIGIWDSDNLPSVTDILYACPHLSAFTIKNLLEILEHSKHVSLDTLDPFPTAASPSAEDFFMDTEEENCIIQTICEILTCEEKEVFLCVVNLKGAKKLTYKQAAEILGLTPYQVLKIYKKSIQKLAANPEISSMRN